MLNLALNNKRPVVVLARPGGLMQAVLMFLGVSRRSNCSVRKKLSLNIAVSMEIIWLKEGIYLWKP